jgi:hexulose-6-phosphate isomerase
MMNRIGIMQGRLVPPVENRIQCFPRANWEMEFALAAEAGLSAIEWIYDLYGADVNPLGTDQGMERMESLSLQHHVAVRSICADYFMDQPLVRASAAELEERSATLLWLMRRAQRLGIGRLVLPFVDSSRIETNEEMASVTAVLTRVLPLAEETGIELHLETSLTPSRFAELLDQLPHALLKVNYDSGNSSSLGYNCREEFAAYGTRVGSVHIKDRIRGGATVALGTGGADFAVLFDCLSEVRYAEDIILQVARDASGDEVNWARQNRAFVLNHLSGSR